MTSDRVAVDEGRLISTTDARVWAEEFCRAFAVDAYEGDRCVPIPADEQVGLMIGWFANAMNTAHRHGFDQGRRMGAQYVE